MSKAIIQNSLQILQQLEKELEKSKTSIQSQSSMSQLSTSSPLEKKQQNIKKELTKQSEAINIINEIDLIQNKQFKQASQHNNSTTVKISPLKRKLFLEDPFQQKCNFLQRSMQQEFKQFNQDVEFLQKDLEQTRSRLQSLLQNQQIYS